MSAQVRAILFDLGNVLLDFDYSIAAKRIAHFCDKGPRDIAGFFLSSGITGVFEKGEIAPEEFFSRVKGAFNLSLSYDKFVPIWNEVFFLSAKNRCVYSLANNLRNNYKIAVLSNINALHYGYIQERFPVLGIFHRVFASCQMGLAKPDPRIYLQAAASLGVLPGEVFYTDDREELVKSAASLGIKSFVFTGAGRLKSDLLDSGVRLA